MSVNNYSANVISQQLSRKFNATTRRKFASLVVVVREGLIIQSSSQHLIRTKVQRPFTSLPPPLPSRPNFDRCPFFHRRPSFASFSPPFRSIKNFLLVSILRPDLFPASSELSRPHLVENLRSTLLEEAFRKAGPRARNGARKLTRSLTWATNLS